MAGVMLAALDQSIVGTALPTHRQRAGWARQARLGGDRLPFDGHRLYTALGQDLGPLWPAEHLSGRDPDLPRRFGLVRAESEPAPADRIPSHPGDRRGRADGPRVQYHRRHHPSSRARSLPGLFRRRVRRRQRGRTTAGRLVHRRTRLALDLLYQPAGGHRRPRHHLDGPEAADRPPRAHHRLPGRGADRGQRLVATPLPRLGREGIWLVRDRDRWPCSSPR